MLWTYFLIMLVLWIPASVLVLRVGGEIDTWDMSDGEDRLWSLFLGFIAALFWPLALIVSLVYFGFRFAVKVTEPKK